MNLKVKQMSIHRRRYLPDIVVVEAEVPGMNKTAKMEVELEEGEGLRYLQKHFSQGELGNYDLRVLPFKS